MDDFCSVCFLAQHRKGKRATHNAQSYSSAPVMELLVEPVAAPAPSPVPQVHVALDDKSLIQGGGAVWFVQANLLLASVVGRAKYIPLRLSGEERKYLALLEAVLEVSEYTDEVDILSYTDKHVRYLFSFSRPPSSSVFLSLGLSVSLLA